MSWSRAVLYLMSTTLVSGGAMALRAGPPPDATAQPFHITAASRPAQGHILVDLSVTNVSPQSQLFWRAAGYCTNQHWRTDVPGIWLHDGMLVSFKTCMSVCEHRVTLAPGQKLVMTLPLEIARNARPGRRLVRFCNTQPSLEEARLVDQHLPLTDRRYDSRVFWSKPTAITIDKRFLGM